MERKLKIEILKYFETLSKEEKNKIASRKWKYLPECLDYSNREEYYKKGKQIDYGGICTDYPDLYFYSNDDYYLYDLGDKYFIEHENYVEGSGTDHWCYLVSKGR